MRMILPEDALIPLLESLFLGSLHGVCYHSIFISKLNLLDAMHVQCVTLAFNMWDPMLSSDAAILVLSEI
jgi:hypothetical protein